PVFFFSSRRRHTRFSRDWSSDVCSSDLLLQGRRGVHQHVIPPLDGGIIVGAADLGGGHLGDVGHGIGGVVPKPVKGRLSLRRGRSEERRVGKKGKSRVWG